MSNGKSEKPTPALAFNDFYKTNGVVHAPAMPGGPSLTRQEFAAECDINTIMKNYDQYLSDPMRTVREPRYVDLTDYPQDLMGFMHVVKEGEEAFMRLPAQVRREFDNDAIAFIDFASNPENLDQMREWGLAPPAKPVGVPAPAPAAAAGAASAPTAAPSAAPAAGASAPAAGPSTHGST